MNRPGPTSAIVIIIISVVVVVVIIISVEAAASICRRSDSLSLTLDPLSAEESRE